MKPKAGKDLTPKSPTKVKGGRLVANDNVTLIRGKTRTISRNGGKDLTPKSPTKVKGGRLVGNDNITLVRSHD